MFTIDTLGSVSGSKRTGVRNSFERGAPDNILSFSYFAFALDTHSVDGCDFFNLFIILDMSLKAFCHLASL